MAESTEEDIKIEETTTEEECPIIKTLMEAIDQDEKTLDFGKLPDEIKHLIIMSSIMEARDHINKINKRLEEKDKEIKQIQEKFTTRLDRVFTVIGLLTDAAKVTNNEVDKLSRGVESAMLLGNLLNGLGKANDAEIRELKVKIEELKKQ